MWLQSAGGWDQRLGRGRGRGVGAERRGAWLTCEDTAPGLEALLVLEDTEKGVESVELYIAASETEHGLGEARHRIYSCSCRSGCCTRRVSSLVGEKVGRLDLTYVWLCVPAWMVEGAQDAAARAGLCYGTERKKKKKKAPRTRQKSPDIRDPRFSIAAPSAYVTIPGESAVQCSAVQCRAVSPLSHSLSVCTVFQPILPSTTSHTAPVYNTTPHHGSIQSYRRQGRHCGREEASHQGPSVRTASPLSLLFLPQCPY